jgi:hypothetical protein
MSNIQRNLGRGLDDLINEVSTVKAVTGPAPRPAPVHPPAQPAAPEAPVAAARPRARRGAQALAAALFAMTALAAVLGWQLWKARHPEWRPKGTIEVVGVEPLTPMQVGKDSVAPATPAWAVAWADAARAAGGILDIGAGAVRILFDAPLFTSGVAVDAAGPLAGVARALLGADGGVEVTVLGHTSSDPVRPGGAYATRDDLAFARAVAVVNLLRAQGVKASLKAGVGPAPHANDDPVSRAKNRSVTIEVRPAA